MKAATQAVSTGTCVPEKVYCRPTWQYWDGHAC